jgi:hypothetical protein
MTTQNIYLDTKNHNDTVVSMEEQMNIDNINRCGCGGKAIVNWSVIPSPSGQWTVYCPECFCNSNINTTKEIAIEKWNRGNPINPDIDDLCNKYDSIISDKDKVIGSLHKEIDKHKTTISKLTK